jgi:hypothetical protein
LHNAIDEKKTRIPLTSISNYNLPSSKSITILVDSNCNQNNVTTKDDLLVFLGERTFVVIFLPNQVTVVKRLLQKAQYHKDNFTLIMAMLPKKTTWQEKVQKLAHNHVDRTISIYSISRREVYSFIAKVCHLKENGGQ